jgi:hypothetical protein
MQSTYLSRIFIAVALMLALAACNGAPARTDAQVAAEVQGTITRDSRVSSRDVSVIAEKGVITLAGNVASDDERAAAATDAAGVQGVRTVVNNLVVQGAAAEPAPASSPKPAAGSHAASKPAMPKPGKEARPVGELPKAPLAASNEPVASQAAPLPAAPPQPPPPPKKVSVPAGTQINVRLNDGLDTEKNQVGDTFHATLGAPIVINDETVIPSGADVTGRVVDVKSAGRFAGNSVLTLELSSLSMNGKTYNIQTSQWSRQGKGEGKNTAVKAGGGAAIGAIIGGIAGGGKGAAIGTAAGAGAGTGAAATKKGEQIKLAPEASLSFLLINPLTVTPQSTNQRSEGRTSLQ